jgi:leucyl aminopeptidase (aminopeptidase T)
MLRATWRGVQALLDDYARLEAEDTVVLLYTGDSYEAAAWVSAAVELRGVKLIRVWMAPLVDRELPERLAAVLPAPDELGGRLVLLTFERDTMSHTEMLTAALSRYDSQRCVVLRAISASESLFADTLRTCPEELSARNAAVLERLMGADHVRITTRGGTNLEITLDARHRWISNRGAWRPGQPAILPAGEVATFPASIDGIFVADFAFNLNAITDRDARLGEHPVSVRVQDGRAVEYACADPGTYELVEACFSKVCAHNVGELGFGTNPGVVEAVAMNSHINERRPGIHLGFGQHNQQLDVVGYQCTVHLDLIARGGLVWVDDDPRPLDLERVEPSPQRQHPRNLREEDLFAPVLDDLETVDCCGIFSNDGLRLFSGALPGCGEGMT